MDSSTRQRLLVLEAKRWIGVREQGDNKGQLIEMFQKAVDNRAVSESWCCGFAQFCVKAVDKQADEVANQSTQPNILKQTELCTDLWNSAELKLDKPEPGCLMIWQHYKDGKPTISGHVGIVVEVKEEKVCTIEGNTSDGTGINRDGDGVYLRERSLTGSPEMKVLGWIKPWRD